MSGRRRRGSSLRSRAGLVVLVLLVTDLLLGAHLWDTRGPAPVVLGLVVALAGVALTTRRTRRRRH